MPSRKPIIPGTSNRTILRALHNEMKEKKIITQTKPTNFSDTTSSGIHSNSSSEAGDVITETSFKKSTRNKRKMTRSVVESEDAQKTFHAHESVDTDDSTGTDDGSDVSDDDAESERSTTSSVEEDSEEEKVLSQRWQQPIVKTVDSDKNKRFARQSNGISRPGLPNNNQARHLNNNPNTLEELLRRRIKHEEEIEFSLEDKRLITEGYNKFVLNGPKQKQAGTSFGNKKEIVKNHVQVTEDQDVKFPLENAASGIGEPMSVKEARSLEQKAKRKTKSEKRSVSEAKLAVGEAKLGEFEAKLRARQSKIDERHAKLCRRHAILKQAEERLMELETKLDVDEEGHRERERRVKNRERRVRQEEAGLQIKESSLRKREEKVTENIRDIERRKKLVEEKEDLSNTMEEIMKKRENLHRADDGVKKSGVIGNLGKKLLRTKNEFTSSNDVRLRDDSSLLVRSHNRRSTGAMMSHPIPVPRKSLEKRESSEDRRNRSNSINSDSVFDEKANHGKKGRQLEAKKVSASLPRHKAKTTVVGLWL
nr:golgin subfamily A member 6-like protein 6 [Ciona intestinalis]XP_026696484.1 golgin subfamily A member 6-like protein 6 [Ciona intestinalis]|eukprot:XP_002127328.1 golgin subfamily A member 6-like protein 6 [Ciona intestinalis]